MLAKDEFAPIKERLTKWHQIKRNIDPLELEENALAVELANIQFQEEESEAGSSADEAPEAGPSKRTRSA